MGVRAIGQIWTNLACFRHLLCHYLCHRFIASNDRGSHGKVAEFQPCEHKCATIRCASGPAKAGLCVIANGDGRKIWRFRRRVAKSGTVVTLKLGPFPAYSIPAARKWAAGLNEMIERGEDPRVAMRTEKAQQELTVKKAHEIYNAAMKRGDRKTLRPRTLSDKAVIFKRDIEPRLGSKALYDLTENEC